MSTRHVVVIAGANGSGKSTAAPDLLRDYLEISEFVNADVIAQGLSGFNVDTVALEAGRIMLQRLRHLATQQVNFAFETTLASRTYARWLTQLRDDGYRVHLSFLWLPSEEMAVARVASRVERGGHDIPEDVIRRRYHAGLKNFSACTGLPLTNGVFTTTQGSMVTTSSLQNPWKTHCAFSRRKSGTCWWRRTNDRKELRQRRRPRCPAP